MNEDKVFSLLSADSGVAALCPSTSIFPVEAPQGATFPRILYSLVTSNPANGFDVPVIDNALVSIDVYATTRQQMRQLADAVRVALETTGLMRGVILEEFQPESKVYRRALLFSFWFNREE